MKKLALLFLLFGSVLYADDDCVTELATLGRLYEVRDMVLDPGTNPSEIERWIDRVTDDLREPLPEGGYRWVEMVRPGGDGPVAKEKHFVYSVVDSGDYGSFRSASENTFAVELIVPRKRNLFRSNHRVWVGTVTIRIWVDGEMTEQDESLDVWMAPSSTRSFDFEEIVDRAEIRLDVATDEGWEDSALIEVHFREAIPRDNPENPAHEAIQSLERVRSKIDPSTIDSEIARIEEGIAPRVDAVPVTQLVLWIREYDRLLDRDDDEDQEKAEEMQERAEELWEKIVRSLPR